ncbi:hypothetical protein DV713_06975 [Parageobacillus thermoglucosidasius]|nr:hypothetical protein DV713_06975 [Parageobacillus thermoglucosidasius]
MQPLNLSSSVFALTPVNINKSTMATKTIPIGKTFVTKDGIASQREKLKTVIVPYLNENWHVSLPVRNE